jgi:superfamily I DNA/RNA helicase
VKVRDVGEEEPLFGDFTDEMLERLGVAARFTPRLREVTDPNSMGLMLLLNDIESAYPNAATLLLAYATGHSEERDDVLAIARGEREFRPVLRDRDEAALQGTTDEFMALNDPDELQDVLERGKFEQWQLFLHPDQQSLVQRSFDGPARLRGISGSGKTVVALHRAWHLAKALAPAGQRVLVTTFNRALARSAGRLLDSLCGAEREMVEATHLHRWCLDFIDFRGLKRPLFTPEAKQDAMRALRPFIVERALNLPEEYVWDEVEFLMGRFLHEERERYLTTDRAGRGRALAREQREIVLSVYEEYIKRLAAAGHTDPAEFVRIAYRLRRDGEEPQYSYGAVVVDEVQDISEIGLKLLHSLVGDVPDGLFLVGDGTQRIFTKGYSSRGLGIDIAGRSVILRKNYRNTRQILEAAFPLIADEWRGEVHGAGGDPETAAPVPSVREGPRPAIVRCATFADEVRFLRNEVKYLLKTERYTPREICVMARSDGYRQIAMKALEEGGVPVIHYRAEVSDPLGDTEKVRVSSLHSGKGHEYAAVLICGLVEGVLPRSAFSHEELGDERAVLYVGMTRARDIVYLCYSDRGESGQVLRRSRFIDQIVAHCDELTFP